MRSTRRCAPWTRSTELAEPHALLARDGHVATVTLNRPAARNALSAQMLALLDDAWTEIDDDPEIRVAVLTGAGGTFCAGMDLKALIGESDDNTAPDPEKSLRGLLRHHQLRKPLIAAVEGYALAGGMELLMATDIRVVAEGATFGLTEVTRGLFPIAGSTVRLRRQVGYARAMEIMLLGRHFGAENAERWGLVNRVVGDGQALDTALALAEELAANGPLAVQAVKRSVQATDGLPEVDGLAKELELGLPVFFTEDAREGARAFKEKRPPRFEGR